jgi:predicted anti-sigma-YlaC factor YlaD
VEKHLETCPTCPPLYAALVGTTHALHASASRDPDTVVPPDLAERLMKLWANDR